MAGRTQRFDSRQSMRGKRFEVFHYREKKTEKLEVHHHDFFEIYFLLNGQVTFRVEGSTYALEPGDLLLINPQELHHAQVSPGGLYERIVLWIDRGYLQELCGGEDELAACFDNASPNYTNFLRPSRAQRAELRELLEKLTSEFYGDHLGGELYARGLLLQFIVEINRLAGRSRRRAKTAESPDLMRQVLAYISSHYHENITLDSLSGEFYVSKYYLSHEFSRRVGTSVYRYIIFRRLMRARELLEAGQPPGAVCQSCGFGDYANFYRAFKSEYGVGPREFAAAAGE